MAKIILIEDYPSSRTEFFFALDTSSTTGAGKTGATGLSAYYVRSNTPTTITAITSPAFTEVDSTNMAGLYRLTVPQIAFAAGAKTCVVYIKGTGIAPVVLEYQLTQFDLETAKVQVSAIDNNVITNDTLAASASEEIADQVWDEAISGHTVSGSFGKLVKNSLYSIDGSVSSNVTPTTKVFSCSLTTYPQDALDHQTLVFLDGNCVGQAMPIKEWAFVTGTPNYIRVTLEEALTQAPASGDNFIIFPTHVHSTEGIAQAFLDKRINGSGSANIVSASTTNLTMTIQGENYFIAGDKVKFSSTAPTPFVVNTEYTVSATSLSPTQFVLQIDAVDTAPTQTGTYTVIPYQAYTVRAAMQYLRNKVALASSTLTVYTGSDTEESWTAAVATDPSAAPITSSNPT